MTSMKGIRELVIIRHKTSIKVQKVVAAQESINPEVEDIMKRSSKIEVTTNLVVEEEVEDEAATEEEKKEKTPTPTMTTPTTSASVRTYLPILIPLYLVSDNKSVQSHKTDTKPYGRGGYNKGGEGK